MSVTEMLTSVFLGAHVWLTYAALAFVIVMVALGMYRALRDSKK